MQITSKQILYDYFMSLVGTPYRWGGDDPLLGFDCSGMMLEGLWSQGLGPKNDSTAEDIRLYYREFVVFNPSFGCLVFFGKIKATHIGFCLNERLMIEAGGGGSATTTREAAAAQNAYIRIRPILHRKDVLGYAMPPWP